MKVSESKNNILGMLILVFIVPIFLTVIMLLQWDPKNGVVMGIILGIIWLIAIGIAISMFKDTSKNPYPFSYLVDYDTLIRYMEQEEKFSKENSLELGFHYYYFIGKEKNEVEAFHYSFSKFDSEKQKGDIYYWNKEEFKSLEELISNKINRFDGHVLIELIDTDNELLNNYKKDHEELDVSKFIEDMKNN